MGSASRLDAGPREASSHKRLLRNYILDKKLQLRYVLVVTLLSAAITALLGYFVWYQQNYASEKIQEQLARPDMSWLSVQMKATIVQALTRSDQSLLLKMVTVGLGLISVLSLFVMVMTHKIAGPLYKIGKYFDRIRDGQLPRVHELRRGDELQDFFEKFKEMDESLRARTKAEVEVLERFLGACRSAGMETSRDLSHCLDELHAMKRRKELALSD
ncbi:MAG: methyl-accepting chemotaxis protein [Deltaproteobacteria bacterium]|nr:methyl-accepting chemotaxis protein [Deltaproteobacteria bacterium]